MELLVDLLLVQLFWVTKVSLDSNKYLSENLHILVYGF